MKRINKWFIMLVVFLGAVFAYDQWIAKEKVITSRIEDYY